MNNITIELCKEDRERLDKLREATEALHASLLANQGLLSVAELSETAPQEPVSAPQATQEPPTGKTTTPAADAPQTAAETPTEADAVTLADVQRKVVELCGPAHNKKAEVKEIVKAYAPKVTGIPADKCAEVMDKLIALEG